MLLPAYPTPPVAFQEIIRPYQLVHSRTIRIQTEQLGVKWESVAIEHVRAGTRKEREADEKGQGLRGHYGVHQERRRDSTYRS